MAHIDYATHGAARIWLNEHEIRTAFRRYAPAGEDEVLTAAATTLFNLMDWTNDHSDGWPYWRKPAHVSAKLQALIYKGKATAEEYKQALIPVKAFRTRQRADFEIVAAPSGIRRHTDSECEDGCYGITCRCVCHVAP